MKIVVATDLSSHNTTALSWAAAYAIQHVAELHVIHVVDDVGDQELWTVLFETPRDIEARLVESLAQQTRTFIDTHAPNAPVTTIRVTIGQPTAEIARFVDEIGADLVVLSTSGQSRLKRAFLGSTAFRLPHATTVPMVFVPHDAKMPPCTHALIAVDLSDVTPHVLKWVADHLDGVELTVVHSAGLTRLASTIGPSAEFVSTLRELTEQRQASIEKLIGEHGLTGTVVIEQDAAAEAISTVARERGADLIVMGSRGLGAIERFMLGSVTQQIVRETEIPVIAIRD